MRSPIIIIARDCVKLPVHTFQSLHVNTGKLKLQFRPRFFNRTKKYTAQGRRIPVLRRILISLLHAKSVINTNCLSSSSQNRGRHRNTQAGRKIVFQLLLCWSRIWKKNIRAPTHIPIHIVNRTYVKSPPRNSHAAAAAALKKKS